MIFVITNRDELNTMFDFNTTQKRLTTIQQINNKI